MELIKQNLVIISFKKHKLGSALGDPFKECWKKWGYLWKMAKLPMVTSFSQHVDLITKKKSNTMKHTLLLALKQS